ncbi:hypothetical protein HG531_010078 [Fusarium graminearum]|nr:hypothetical protein HG531_010078 [Fusarium graminearum]
MHRADDGSTNGLGVQLQALVGGARQVVLVVGGVLILLGEEKQKNWYDLVGSDAGKVVEGTHLIRTLDLGVIVLDRDLLFANSAPELDGQLGDILVIRLHAKNCEAEQGLLHVESHILVVEGHDSVQAAKGALLYP